MGFYQFEEDEEEEEETEGKFLLKKNVHLTKSVLCLISQDKNRRFNTIFMINRSQ